MTAVCCTHCGHLTADPPPAAPGAMLTRFWCGFCQRNSNDLPFEPSAKHDAFDDLFAVAA